MSVSYSKSFLCSTALALTLPGAALADVTAAEVWDNWKSYAESFGQTVTAGAEIMDGDTLTLQDVKMTMNFPEGSVVSNMATLELQERSDGTVAITMAPEYPIHMSVDDEEQVEMSLLMQQKGASIVASGGDGTIVYDYLAAELSFSVEELIVDDEVINPTVNVALKDIDGKYESTDGTIQLLTSQLTAAVLEYTVDFVDPADGGHFALSGSVVNLSSTSDVSIPAGLDFENPSEIFNSAFALKGGFKAGSSEFNMSLKDSAEAFDVSGSGDTSGFDVSVKDGTLEYGGTTTGVNYRLVSPQIPLPEVTLGMAEAAFNVVMPLTQTDGPQDFAMLFKLGGLEVSDMIWGMIDAAGALPHDPATLILDVAGQLKWLVDITDEKEMAAFSGDTPAEIYGLTVNDVTLAIAGAEVTGKGDFTFDNTDLTTFDGIPAPSGTIDFDLLGVNGLLDTLGQMGLLPQEQAMGARMMLGLFARPGQGEDHLVSTIEVKGDGSVYANDQQIK